MLFKGQSGHPGTPMGWRRWPIQCGRITYATIRRSRCGQTATDSSFPPARFMLIYSILHLTQVQAVDENDKFNRPAVAMEDLKASGSPGSVTPGHPEYRHTAGVEATTGPLGQGGR